MRAERFGAYGLCPRTILDLPSEWLSAAPDNWVDWTFEWSVDPAATVAAEHRDDFGLGPDSALLPLQPTGYVEVDREARSSHFTLNHELTANELLHPAMASTAALHAWWEGRLALHGAAARDPKSGQTLGFLGERERGKSSSVAWLRTQGWVPVSDDVLVINECEVLPGPRIVDLRAPTAQGWGMGTAVGRLGQRERWRVYSEAVPPRNPLGGLVCLEWGSETSLKRLGINERLAAFSRHNVLQVPPRNANALLSLLSIPTFELSRPPSLDLVPEVMNLLLTQLASGDERAL